MMHSIWHVLWREAVEWAVSFCLGVVFYALLMRGSSWSVFITCWLAGTAFATALQCGRRWCAKAGES